MTPLVWTRAPSESCRGPSFLGVASVGLKEIWWVTVGQVCVWAPKCIRLNSRTFFPSGVPKERIDKVTKAMGLALNETRYAIYVNGLTEPTCIIWLKSWHYDVWLFELESPILGEYPQGCQCGMVQVWTWESVGALLQKMNMQIPVKQFWGPIRTTTPPSTSWGGLWPNSLQDGNRWLTHNLMPEVESNSGLFQNVDWLA